MSSSSGNVKDKELKKFALDVNGDICVRTCDSETHDKLETIAGALGASTTVSKSVYNEVSTVAQNVETVVASFTAIEVDTFIQRITTSGCNIAEYKVKVNGTVIDKKLTYFGSALNSSFEYHAASNLGHKITTGDIVTVTVIHQRPDSSDFNARIQIVEQV